MGLRLYHHRATPLVIFACLGVGLSTTGYFPERGLYTGGYYVVEGEGRAVHGILRYDDVHELIGDHVDLWERISNLERDPRY